LFLPCRAIADQDTKEQSPPVERTNAQQPLEEDEFLSELKKLRAEIEASSTHASLLYISLSGLCFPISTSTPMSRTLQILQAQQQVWLLGEEDKHLKVLKEELEELSQGIQEDLASCPSGQRTPAGSAPPRHDLVIKRDSLELIESSSSSLQLATPSPKRSSRYEAGVPSHRLAFSDSNSLTSGEASPYSPCSPPRYATNTSARSNAAAAVITMPFLPLPPAAAAQTFWGDGVVMQNMHLNLIPEVAVTPPLPPSGGAHTACAPATLEAALEAALEDGGMALEDWENEEEWLIKPDCVQGDGDVTAKPPVRPLPRVPKLNLQQANGGGGGGLLSARDGTGASSAGGGNPLTISARAGIAIARRQKTARGTSTRCPDATYELTNPPRIARGQTTSRNSSSGGSTSPPPSLQLLAQGVHKSKTRAEDAPTPRFMRSLDPGFKAQHSRTSSRSSLRRSPSALSIKSDSSVGGGADGSSCSPIGARDPGSSGTAPSVVTRIPKLKTSPAKLNC